jgi:predicted hotdog family 3-hydroxylacyl-ACP dehydratase
MCGPRRYEARTPVFTRDAQLNISVNELLRSEEGHGAYQCTIGHDGAVCAEAIVKVYQPRDFQSFIEESFRP